MLFLFRTKSREERLEEEYLRAEREYERKEREAERRERWDLPDRVMEREERGGESLADIPDREDYVPEALPPKDYPKRAPQLSGPSLGDYGKFCLLIFVILSLGLCVMGSCFFVPTIIGFLWGQ
jgi:hypothetical protein